MSANFKDIEQVEHCSVAMDLLQNLVDVQLLLMKSQSVLKASTVGRLKDLCTKYNLLVGASGLKNKSIKADYVAAILVHVSSWSDEHATHN
jgi:hypothetical protein